MFDKFSAVMNRTPVRVLSLVMALTLAGCVFWDPARFAAKTSSLAIWQGVLIVWAACTGVIHGVGFQPRYWLWRLFFTPLPAFVILIAGLFYFFT